MCCLERVDYDHLDFLTGNHGIAPAGHGNQVQLIHRAQVFRCPVEHADQEILQRGTDHGSTPEAHDGHARGQAPAVREPLEQCADRGNVTQAQPCPANHTIAEV